MTAAGHKAVVLVRPEAVAAYPPGNLSSEGDLGLFRDDKCAPFQTHSVRPSSSDSHRQAHGEVCVICLIGRRLVDRLIVDTTAVFAHYFLCIDLGHCSKSSSCFCNHQK